jgi:2-amino-4-hydroxy-6-hydroxymethyldihydropteridine diphosphokinase
VTDVYVAAGSNIDPLPHLRQALEAMQDIFGPLRISPAYRNKAVGFSGADFVNLVVGFGTAAPVGQVREQLQRIESLCGRAPHAPKWAARSIDLDILLYGDLICDESGLLIPRPDLLRRPYMLKPMADIGPDVEHPLEKKSLRQLWKEFDGEGHEMTEMGQPADWPTGCWPE